MHSARASSHPEYLLLALRSRLDWLRHLPDSNPGQEPSRKVRGHARWILSVVRHKQGRKEGRDRPEVVSRPLQAALWLEARPPTYHSLRLNPRRGQVHADRARSQYREMEPGAAKRMPLPYAHSEAIEERPGDGAVCDGR